MVRGVALTLGGTVDQRIVTGAHNRFDRMEFAGALGDLGTLVPFVVAWASAGPP